MSMSRFSSARIKSFICGIACFGLVISLSQQDVLGQRGRSGKRVVDSKTSGKQEETRRRPDRQFLPTPKVSDAASFIEKRIFDGDGGVAAGGEEFRTFNGLFNNLDQPRLGSIFTPLLRVSPAAYGPGNSLARANGTSARLISNIVFNQPANKFNDRGLSDFAWQWGQFMDHDLDLTEFQLPRQAANIVVPGGDPIFDPLNTGTAVIPFDRSLHTQRIFRTNLERQQLNEITAWIDASNVYGSDLKRANALRELTDGKMRTSSSAFGDLLPLTEDGTQFFAGDIRSTEQVGLATMHTLFVREHNRLATAIKADNPDFTDEQIYQRARQEVYGILEAITFNEWLPALFGPNNPLTPYGGYDSSVNPNIANEFSGAAFRFGHTMLSNQLMRLNNDGDTIAEGNILLRSAFFNPSALQDVGPAVYLKGLMTQQAQEIDAQMVGAVRNFLFANGADAQPGPSGPLGFDLMALNIQRGRDHGIPDYNTLRVAYGLPAVNSFAEITSNALLQAQLAAVYDTVNDIDPLVGILAEDHASESSLSETAIAVFKDQFERVRDGDRFWYENVFTGEDLDRINNTTLADVIRRNTDLTNVQDNVFFAE